MHDGGVQVMVGNNTFDAELRELFLGTMTKPQWFNRLRVNKATDVDAVSQLITVTFYCFLRNYDAMLAERASSGNDGFQSQ